MRNQCEQLKEWNESFGDYEPTQADNLPDIDLYMDQVITFITRQMDVFIDENEKLITPSMINNYTKNDIIPRPINKRYDSSHLMSIMMLCVLKQIIPIKDAAIFFEKKDREDILTLYEEFISIQKEKVATTSGRLRESIDVCEGESFEHDMMRAAMEMIIEANVLSTAAKKILHELYVPPAKNDKHDRNKHRS